MFAQSLQALEGGNGADVVMADPAAEVSTYLELVLLVAPGLRDAAMTPLYKAAKPALASASSAVQKKGYKALAYLTNCRSAPLYICRTNTPAVSNRKGGIVCIVLNTKLLLLFGSTHTLSKQL